MAIACRVVAFADWDLSALASFGIEEPRTLEYASERLGTVAARSSIGHDGRFFFVQANDPLLMDTDENAATLDRPTYRSQRMLYPLLAGLGGWLSPMGVLWGLLIVNLLAVAMGTFAVASYALRHGLSCWLGLAFVLNPGIINELTIDGAGVLAFALVCMAVVVVQREQMVWAAALLAMAALTREVMLVSAAGTGLWLVLRGRRAAGVISFLVPLGAVLAWAGYVRWRMPSTATVDIEEIGAPFVGLFEAVPRWSNHPAHLVVGLVVLLCLGLFVAQLMRGRADPLAFASMGFVGVAVLLTAQVWTAGFDITRAVAPVFTTVVVNPRFAHRRTNT